jgi:hypothetical protein
MAEPLPAHLRRDACIYVRQSTLAQTMHNSESLHRQYDLSGRARALGWAGNQIVVIDDDLGRSGSSTTGRRGFAELVADVGLGKAGIILSLEVSRLARNNTDWYQLLDLCALTDTLIADADGIYHPAAASDRLLPGVKGTMSEAYADVGIKLLMPTCGLCRVVTWLVAFAQLTRVRSARRADIIQMPRAACCRKQRACRSWHRPRSRRSAERSKSRSEFAPLTGTVAGDLKVL